MAAIVKVAAILIFSAAMCICSGCDVDDVAVYKVTLQTFWSEDRFPKDYPVFRPKAQWSQLFGQSHNASYTLYRLNEVAKASVLKFSQYGNLEELIEEGEDDAKIYDQFSGSAIGKGEGKTENMVFVDGGHNLVSAMCRIVPSPDWFVGVDSLNLCVDSAWIEQITLDLDPLDAGAASGLTFTAPRWETSPPAPVAKHSPKSPNHPAAGFYYPELKTLPSIAKIEFTKLKEYSTKELNNLARKEVIRNVKTINIPNLMNIPTIYREEETNDYTTKNNLETLKDLEEEPVGTPKPDLDPDNIVEVVTKKATPTTTTTEAEFDPDLNNMDELVLAVAHGRKLGLGKHLPRHFRSRLHHAVNKLTPNDCLVSDWSEWTPCSKTCGFGDKFRTRSILRKPTMDGRKCPELKDRTHCGNVNSCYDMEYFDW